MADSAVLELVEEPPAAEGLRRLCYADPEFARRYEGWELIGRGAFATVVKVRFMGEPLALKIFTNLTEDGRARLRSEYASAFRLNSPHVVRTLSAYDRGSIAWIEMEAVDGPNLDEELEQRERQARPFTLADSLEIAIAVTGVVADAHDLGIVHRDIKPANILLPRGSAAAAKLGDFGIARLAGAAKLTAEGAFPGTPRWASPEAFAGRALGPPADVYSLCLCLFALFTSNHFPWPVEQEAPVEAYVNLHVKKPPRRLRDVAPGIPSKLESIVDRGLDKRPGRRPSARSLLDALVDARSRLARSGHTAASVRVRSAATVKAAAIALIAAAGLTTGYLARWGGAMTPTRAKAPIPAPNATLAIPATPAVAPEPVASPPIDVSATLRGDFLHVRNGERSLASLKITVIDDRRRPHVFTIDSVEPDDVFDVSLREFSPAIGRQSAPVEVQFQTGVGRAEVRLARE